MVIVRFDPLFERAIRKIKDTELKNRIKKHIEKIVSSPTIGKPVRFNRKGTRGVHIPPFRLSYMYSPEEDRLLFLDLYHKDEQ